MFFVNIAVLHIAFIVLYLSQVNYKARVGGGGRERGRGERGRKGGEGEGGVALFSCLPHFQVPSLVTLS